MPGKGLAVFVNPEDNSITLKGGEFGDLPDRHLAGLGLAFRCERTEPPRRRTRGRHNPYADDTATYLLVGDFTGEELEGIADRLIDHLAENGLPADDDRQPATPAAWMADEAFTPGTGRDAAGHTVH